jgi:hypothetical protein
MSKGIKGLLAGAVLGTVTTSANAAMIVTSTRDPGTGTAQPNGLDGYDIVRFFAKFDATSPEGLAGAIGLQSVKATLNFLPINKTSTFKFRTVDLDGAPVDENDTPIANDFDVQLTKTNKTTARTSTSAVGTTIRAWDFNNNGDPDATFTVTGLSPTGNTNANPGIPPNYTNVREFSVEGALLNPVGRTAADTHAKVANAATAARNAGALFAIAVVPTGADVQLTYDLAADKGDHTVGVWYDPFDPEPSTFGLLAVGAAGVLTRRSCRA